MGFDYLPDYSELHDRYEAEKQRELDKMPKCSYCNKPITEEHLYDFGGEIICESCLNDNYRKCTISYIEE